MPELIEPGWTLPGITAFTTTRGGGHSAAPWDSFNLGDHVGDDPAAVSANRWQLSAMLPGASRVQWLKQVHGIGVVKAGVGGVPEADACWSDQPGTACAVMTADCLPVLLAARDGSVVAASHAGWRGLLDGVLEASVRAMRVDPMQIFAWMGPAIGPEAFEVGSEVSEAFIAAGDSPGAFRPGRRAGRFVADIYALARGRLQRAGVADVSGGGFCTYSDAERFFSYRRDGDTGRMATVICIDP